MVRSWFGAQRVASTTWAFDPSDVALVSDTEDDEDESTGVEDEVPKKAERDRPDLFHTRIIIYL